MKIEIPDSLVKEINRQLIIDGWDAIENEEQLTVYVNDIVKSWLDNG